MLVETFRIHGPVRMIPFEEGSHPKMVSRRGMMRHRQCFDYPGR